MGAVEGNFGNFGNYSPLAGLSVTFFPPPVMRTGASFPISVDVFGYYQTLSVNVEAMNSQYMTFTTNPGHLIYPGAINFAASPSTRGSINFNIDLGGTIAQRLKYTVGGGLFEDAQWNHFIGQVKSYCGGGG
jgi:hypothetical protein